MVCSYVVLFVTYVGFFFFKQKTAYEMRISEWSSDVCSSDLARPFGHAAEEVELLPEFGVQFAVGNVAARGNIDIVEPDARRQCHPDMARFAIRLPVIFANFGQRQFADDRDAMVHPLAVGDDMLIAEPPEHRSEEQPSELQSLMRISY